MEKRCSFWDNYKGILIFLVVFGHFIYEYATNLPGSFAKDIFTFIYIFHMPAFVFCSGYFSKSERACNKKSITKLILYYLVFNTAMMLYYYFAEDISPMFLTPYNTYWYLLSLITWRLIIKHVSTIKGILPFSLAAALLVGFLGEFTNTFSLVRSIAFFSFFMAGYLFKNEQFDRILQNRARIHPAIRLPIILLGAGIVFIAVSRFNFSIASLSMLPYSSGRDIIWRTIIIILASAAIFAMLITVPDVKIPFLTRIGKNSLTIYLTHRFITLMFDKIFPTENYNKTYLIYAFVATSITVIILGSDFVETRVTKLLDSISSAVIDSSNKFGQAAISCILIFSLLFGTITPAEKLFRKLDSTLSSRSSNVNIQDVVNNSIVISFVGDLILLKEQVESAYNAKSGSYDFSPMFQYVKPYLDNYDLSIGVFEGPTAGEEKGYSTSNFDDGYKFYLNYPDQFASDVKDAGFDFVTLANNHLLDMDVDGAMRTLDVLDEIGLPHTGGYRNNEEKSEITVLDVEGIKIAVLSYTQMVNYYTEQDMTGELSYITSFLPDPFDKKNSHLIDEIKNDFERAKQTGADLIMVLPHMGTQFSFETDDFQDKWNSLFAEWGADIILGDHAHAVQPIEYIGDTLVANCPGNFANSYINYNGDATALIEIYLDRQTKKVSACAVVPMYTQEMNQGFFRALPIYDMMTKNELFSNMPSRDLERVKDVHSIITEIMLGEKIPLTEVKQRYFVVDGKYVEYTPCIIDNTADNKNKVLYKLFSESNDVVFIGDSITAGSQNGGHPWYEPLTEHFSFKSIINISKPSYTTSMITDSFNENIKNSHGDLYIVAIGTNDVRYRIDEYCAMTPTEYIENIAELTTLIKESSPIANIVFISPWMTLENDSNSALPHVEKITLLEEYGTELKNYSDENGFYFINPNKYISDFFTENNYLLYTYDGIHPNQSHGIYLYSKAVFESSP